MDSEETRKGIEKDRYIDGYSQSQILHTTKHKILLKERYTRFIAGSRRVNTDFVPYKKRRSRKI